MTITLAHIGLFVAQCAGTLGKYGSLLYGFNEVVKDNPSKENLALGALAYLVSSGFASLESVYDNAVTVRDPILKKISELEEKLKK